MGRSVVSTEATETGTRRETGSCRPKWSPIPTTAVTWIPVSEPRGKLSSGHLSGVGFGWYLARISLHMQNLILEGLPQKLQKSCSRSNKNTWHVESSYILQPPKYLLLFVNRFRYINNDVTKDRCPIPVDTTVRLGPLKFSPRATIDHHGPSIHSGRFTASINCCKKHSIATITQLRSLELLIKTPMLYYMNWLTHDFWTRTGGWEFDRSHGAGTSSPSHWQQVEEQASRPVGWMMCFLLMTLVPVQKLYVNIYMYMHSLNEFWYRTYIYTTGVSFSIGEAAPHHVL